MNTGSFDLIALIGIAICLQTLWQLVQNWRQFWDDRITSEDAALAQRLALFLLVPLGVFLHEYGHSVATWQAGGQVVAFQWRFMWGYIIPQGSFSPAQIWWIAFSGNLVSIILGLLPIPIIPFIRKRIIAEILYYFVCVQSVYSLVAYPLLSLGSQWGDWVRIYDFKIQPYATATLIGHILLLVGLRSLYDSRAVMAWRLARSPQTPPQWQELEKAVSDRPDELEPKLQLAYFLLQNQEVDAAKRVMQQVKRIASKDSDNRISVLQVAIYYHKQAFRKAIPLGQQLLETGDLSYEDQLRLYRYLWASAYSLQQIDEALQYANRGLSVEPTDYRLRYYRAIAYSKQKRYAEAKADLQIALAESTADEDAHRSIQNMLDNLPT